MPADINPTLQPEREGPGGHLAQATGSRAQVHKPVGAEEGLSETLATRPVGHNPHTGAVAATKEQVLGGPLSQGEGLLPG